MIKDATNINEIKIGVFIQVEQEVQVKGKRTLKFNRPPFKVTLRNLENVLGAVINGRKFKIME